MPAEHLEQQGSEECDQSGQGGGGRLGGSQPQVVGSRVALELHDVAAVPEHLAQPDGLDRGLARLGSPGAAR
jgi:hypothetical protein